MRKLMNKKLNKKGFTLMEMLIVVAIIAILVAIAIPTFSSALNKAHDAADAANLRAYYAEVQMKYLLDKTALPTAATDQQKVTIDGVDYTLYSKYDIVAVPASGTQTSVQFTLHGKTGDITIPGKGLDS